MSTRSSKVTGDRELLSVGKENQGWVAHEPFIPTSTTVAPNLTQSAFTTSAHPTAATSISACLTGRSTLSRLLTSYAQLMSPPKCELACFRYCTPREWITVTDEAPASRNNQDIGIPTTLLSPIIATDLFRTGMFSLRNNSMQPSGAHGRNAGRQMPRIARRPTLLGWSPSTSLLGLMHSSRCFSFSCGGTGS